jgi:hypothetical protein
MFIYAGEDLLQCLLDIFNTMIINNSFDSAWYRSAFTMLPKTGDSSKPSNWRPIAVLKITYKIFAMLLLNRLAPFLEHEQPADQLGFRRGLGIDDAMVVLENVCGKCLAWESDIWFASLDLQKAFDRIEHDSLFQALQAQGVPDTYLQVLRRLYAGQSGIVRGSNCVFDITRGVKQGDVLSPMLFNSGLEPAMRNWKQSLKSHGLHVGAVDRLTNIRYADDLLLFAKSWKELVEMLELLVVELNRVGLQLNTSKTKLFTTSYLQHPLYIDGCGDLLAVLWGEEKHKYLGRTISGHLKRRGLVELQHRIQIGWMTFHKYKCILTNKHIALKLRLQLFDAVVSPTILFGLATLPLTKSDYHTVDKLQRKMLRLIVGWIRHDGEDWSDTMSRMNRRIAFAMTIWECKPWSWQIFSKQFRVATKIFDQQNSWAAATSTWTPTNEWQQNFSTEPKRRQGRPSKRWDDNLEKFAMNYFRMSWGTAARIRPEWQFFEQVYVQFCSSM